MFQTTCFAVAALCFALSGLWWAAVPAAGCAVFGLMAGDDDDDG